MKSADIRNSFLEFFQSKGHQIVRSSSLIPSHDPSLLFTNAGMVQFKSVFLGEEKRPYTRATTSQKCMRAGGKHSDIENVGHTARHHTFFEMLGNFSFGDYFKREAISFAWELLAEWYRLPKDKLWVSVFEEDDEAVALWHDLTGIPYEKIAKLGAKDNFWQMGDTGPCGPCSEVIIDQGADVGCGKPDCQVGCDCDRYLELWNLVFMQYNRDESGTLTPLPKPSIDTGMGLERISAVLQGKLNNFDTDLFTPIIAAVSSVSNISYGKSPVSDVSMRLIADHMRAITFLLSDGLTPSNEGRGYVLRRIIRRASRHARLLGLQDAVMYKFINPVVETLGDLYPELVHERERAAKMLRFEEERFARTLELGMRLLDDIIANLKKTKDTTISGESLFKLYDTYGFPLDLARDIAEDNQLLIDEAGFHREMEFQKERARASWVGEDEAIASVYKELFSEIGETVFVGYDTLESEGIIKAILKDGRIMKEASKGDEVEIFLDKTPFYAESGGQAGDVGIIFTNSAYADVIDTKKELNLNAHLVRVTRGRIRVWERVRCCVDKDKRLATARNHTATHLLHTALRIVLGEHVKQAGSSVSSDRLRFDFTHFYQTERAELQAIEDLVNEKIRENIVIETEVSDIKEALTKGVIALFGEKYGDKVRVVSTPGFSAELCGGTHCRSTGDIGVFIITSEGSVASGIRRIEALTGKSAFEHLQQKRDELRRIADILKTEHPSDRVEHLLAEMKEQYKETTALKAKLSSRSSQDLLDNVKMVDGIKVLACQVHAMEQQDLRTLADSVRERLGSGILVIASTKDGQASFIAMVTRDLAERFSAGKILKKVAEFSGGRGGGKAEMAQGGTKQIEKVDASLEMVYEIVATMV